MTFNTRWMIRRDMPIVQGIEEAVFDNPWTEEEFIRCLRQRNVIAFVAEAQGEIAGYMIYELFKRHLQLLNFAVATAHQRSGVGRAMIARLQTKLNVDRRNGIVVNVRERNLTACYFFRSVGFRAIDVLRGFYDDSDEDAYVFHYCLLPSYGTSPAKSLDTTNTQE